MTLDAQLTAMIDERITARLADLRQRDLTVQDVATEFQVSATQVRKYYQAWKAGDRFRGLEMYDASNGGRLELRCKREWLDGWKQRRGR